MSAPLIREDYRKSGNIGGGCDANTEITNKIAKGLLVL